MANLVSPGVSVTVTDESFFIPAAASTVPLFFITTADEKMRPDGVTKAAGTFESNVIRTVTSLKQSTELYGVPRFLEYSSGNPLHGDARNEYGLFALNQFLGIGNMAYVVRANVNLNDSLVDIRTMWDVKMQESAYVLENLVNAYLNEYNSTNGFVPADVGGVNTVGSLVAGSGYTDGQHDVIATGGTGSSAVLRVNVVGGVVTTATVLQRGANYTIGDILTGSIPGGGAGFSVTVATLTGYRQTVNQSTFLSLVATATADVWESFSFKNSQASFTNDWTTAPKHVFASGYNAPATGSFVGLTGDAVNYVDGATGSVVVTEWTAQEASTTLLGATDAFKYTADFRNQTSLGANDSARRVAIVQALQAAINSNTDIRSETYEYNLILCPGYHEVVDEMNNLRVDIQEEAFVIADVPLNKDPEETAVWASTIERRTSPGIAYYYPHGLASNLDGKNVYVAASGIALRTIAYSDEVSELWFAPAGTRRGLVSGVSNVGYVTGTLGTPTTFTEVALNLGQRDNLYKYFTNINPIVFFPGRGIIVWGQKTSAPDASARDRINVERLIGYIRRQLRKNTMSFVFEPNDQLTRDNLKATVDGFLGDLIVKRGLYDFATVCDTTNNTPDRIDRNELYIDIALKPVKAAEFLHIPIRIVATGAEI